MDKRELRRWLKALAIAKILFEEEGYHTLYLEAIEDFIRNNHVNCSHLKQEPIKSHQ